MKKTISVRRIAAVLRRASRAAILAALVLTLGSCPEMLQTPLLEEVERIVAEGGGSSDTTPPTIGSGLVVGTATKTSIALSWGAATDNTTSQINLQYRVMRADNAGLLGSVESAVQQTIVLDWTSNTTAATASTLLPDTTYWFAVLVKDSAGNRALYAAQPGTTLNAFAPTPGTGPDFSAIGQTSVTVSWTAATDDLTPQANLQYKLVRASADSAIDTVAEADAVTGGGLVMDWRTNDLSETASGLSLYTTYYFAVLVRDEAGNKSLYAPKAVRTLGAEIIIHFNADGGTSPIPSSKSVYHGGTYDVLASTGRTPDFDFKGWWTAPNGSAGSGSEIFPGTAVTDPSTPQTLYASWKNKWEEDGGYGWAYNQYGDVAISANGAIYYIANRWNGEAGTYGLILKSDNGIQGLNNSGAPLGPWMDIACSADGQKVVACAYNGYIYTSTNAGDSFVQRTGAGSRYWSSVACSSDFSVLGACVENGYVYISTDQGATWNACMTSTTQWWTSIAISANGAKIFVAGDNVPITMSDDSGSSWFGVSVERSWTGVACSGDGSRIAACGDSRIYTRIGWETWTERTAAGIRGWSDIEMTADGQGIAACGDYGLYTSIDGGNSWNERWLTWEPVRARQVGISGDGRTIVTRGSYSPYYYYKE